MVLEINRKGAPNHGNCSLNAKATIPNILLRTLHLKSTWIIMFVCEPIFESPKV